MASQNTYAPQFPPQHLSHQQQQFYPTHYPPKSQPPSQTPIYLQPQGFSGQPDGHRQHFHPNLNHGNGQGPLMQPPTSAPPDPFKRPYNQYAQSPPGNFRYDQPSYPSHQARPLAPISGFSSSQLATSMTATALPAVSSAQSTPTRETPAQPPDATAQAVNLSPLDQERVDALLNVNNLLLQEVTILQKAGLKPVLTPQSPQQPDPASRNSPQTKTEGNNTTPTSTDASIGEPNTATASTSSTPTTTTPTTGQPPNNPSQNVRKFTEYMGRIKTNIMYLVTISDPSKAKHRPPYPTHLEEPPAWLMEGVKEEEKELFDALKEAYVKLRELWPDWKVQPRPQMGQQQMMQHQAQAMAQQQAQQQNQQAQMLNQQAQMQHS